MARIRAEARIGRWAVVLAVMTLGLATSTPVTAQPRPVVTDRYSPNPVTVGRLWDGWSNGAQNTNIPPSVLYEPSGIAASRVNSGVLYAHSEKDRQTMVAFDAKDGKLRGKYRVTVPNVFDTEDMAVGPCPTGSCVFLADIGTWRADATKPNNVMSVVRYREPRLAAGQTGGTLVGDYFPYRYPDGQKKDSEALIVGSAGDIYVITKTATGISEVFGYPNPLPAPGNLSTLRKVGELQLPRLTQGDDSVRVTAAAAHPTANRFLVRTYHAVYEFRGRDGGTFASAFSNRVTLTDTGEPQGEAIDYAFDGSSYFTLSERTAPPYTLKRVDGR